MPFVSGQFQFKHVPLLDCLRHLGSVEKHIVCSHSCKQLSLLGAAFPVFELPLVSIDEHSHHSTPSCFSKVLYVVINLEDVLFVPNFVFHFANHVASCVVDDCRWVRFFVLCVNTFFQELGRIANTQISWSQKGRNNNNRTRLGCCRELSCWMDVNGVFTYICFSWLSLQGDISFGWCVWLHPGSHHWQWVLWLWFCLH